MLVAVEVYLIEHEIQPLFVDGGDMEVAGSL